MNGDPFLEHFRRFGRYNRWANAALLDAAAALTAADWHADRGAFFRSLHGTLNHILVADRIWLGRIAGESGPQPALNAILAPDLPALRAAREAEDARLLALLDGLEAEGLHRIVEYRTGAGIAHAQPLHQILAHLFNHQTHHRGQASAILTSLGRPAPEIDLIYFLRQEG